MWALAQCSMCVHCFYTRDTRTIFCGSDCKKASKYYYNREHEEKDEQAYREYHAAYREANRERRRRNALEYNRKNRVRIRESTREWRKRNPNYKQLNPGKTISGSAKARTARYGGRYFPVSDRQLERILLAHNNCCAYCETPLEERFHWDHRVPLSKGGDHSEGNLAPACPFCNTSKHAKFLFVWLTRYGPGPA